MTRTDNSPALPYFCTSGCSKSRRGIIIRNHHKGTQVWVAYLKNANEANLEEIVYEGYGPFGVAIVIETATDNPTRTVANIRSYFNKHDGTLATAGSLEFLFNRRGVFKVPVGTHSIDDLEMELIDAGADDVEHDAEDNVLVAYSDFANFGKMQRALEDKKVEVLSSEMIRLPLNTVALTDEQMEEIAKLLERIEEDDDVQNVFDNIG